jgi:HEAT repeat protein
MHRLNAFGLKLIVTVFLCASSLSNSTECNAQTKDEAALIKILSDSDSNKPDMAIACKELAVVGTANCVDVLAPLLKDSELTSWARIALEAIEAKSAEIALIDAAKELQGRPLIGVVNSLGVKRSKSAVEILSNHIASKNDAVAESAAIALGKIGGADAVQILQSRLNMDDSERRSNAAEGLIRCAEKMLAYGDAEQSAALCDSLRTMDLPLQRKIEATRGAILARGSAGIKLLLATMNEENPRLRRVALKAARQLQGEEAIKTLIDALPKVRTSQRAMYLRALGDRQQPELVPTLIEIVQSDSDSANERAEKLAAIEVLSELGDASCLESLVSAAVSTDESVAERAMNTLAKIDDAALDRAIASQVATAKGAEKRVMLGLIGSRRITEVRPLLDALKSNSVETRIAALMALGDVATLAEIPMLVGQAIKEGQNAESEAALLALKSACVRMPDQAACATQLSTALSKADLPVKLILLEILGSMGGPDALEVVGDVANQSNKELQDASTRLLGDWMSVDAGAILMNVAKQSRHPYRIRALRAYLRLVRQFDMSREERHRMTKAALRVALRDAEKVLVLDAASRYPSKTMLSIAVELSAQPSLKATAQSAAVSIAGKIKPFPGLKRQLERLELPPVDVKVQKAVYGAKGMTKDVTSIIQQKLLPGTTIVSLGSPLYSDVFGGAPTLGSPKELTVSYTVDGVRKDAVFAENSAIVLPTNDQ